MIRELPANLKKMGRYQLFVHFALVILAAEVVLLASQNRELKGNSSSQEQEDSLAVGDYLVTRGLQRIQGEAEINASTTRVIFIFTTRCPFCKINVPRWNELASHLLKKGVRAVGISLDGPDQTKEFLKEYDLNFTTYCTSGDGKFEKQNRFSRVPKTIVRNPSEQITSIWSAVLSKKSSSEVLSLASEEKNTNIQSQGGR